MRNAVRLEDREAPFPATLEELEAEPALPNARLADDTDHLRAPTDRPGERGFQSRGFVLKDLRQVRFIGCFMLALDSPQRSMWQPGPAASAMLGFIEGRLKAS